MMRAVVKDGYFVDKESLLSDVSKAHQDSLYSDITITLSDNVSMSTSRFMLACRVPYFATLLFGGMAAESSVSLKCCDSIVFKQIMNYALEGQVSFLGLSIQSLMSLLETSRFLCIDLLADGIVDHLKLLLQDETISFPDCLEALDFTVSHKFYSASELLLSFIDQNLSSISSDPGFATLAEGSMLAMLNYEGRKSTEIVLFSAFVKWINSQCIKNEEGIEDNIKREMLSCFDLDLFEKKDLVKIVRKTKFFDDADVCNVLEKHLEKVEKDVEAQKSELEAQKREVEAQKREVNVQKREVEVKKKEVEARKAKVETHKKEVKALKNTVEEWRKYADSLKLRL